MDFFDTLLRFFQNGGSFMYPIAIVLFIGLAVVIERWLFLTLAKNANRKAFDRILPMVKKQDYKAVMLEAKNNDAPIARILSAGVARMAQSPRRDDIELAMEEGILEEICELDLK